MYEHWRGNGFIRIHKDTCRHAERNRIVNDKLKHTMYLEGRFRTLKQAKNAAEQKVNRWATCRECCETSS